jgi:phosphoribosylanthranilate isomerase
MKMKTLLKYCGNHSFEDVVVTANSRADYLGFVFAPSKRRVTAIEVKRWLAEINVKQKIVGVFVNASFLEIEDVLEQVPLDVIQCHGEETADYISALKAHHNKVVWKVIHHSEMGLKTMKEYRGLVDGYVIDSRVAGLRGGTGVTFDWESIPSYQQEANFQQVPCFIAGGINSNSVKSLLQYHPVGIDLSSGIEEDGKKSGKIKKQFEARLFI